jgi:hypothetical protein
MKERGKASKAAQHSDSNGFFFSAPPSDKVRCKTPARVRGALCAFSCFSWFGDHVWDLDGLDPVDARSGAGMGSVCINQEERQMLPELRPGNFGGKAAPGMYP